MAARMVPDKHHELFIDVFLARLPRRTMYQYRLHLCDSSEPQWLFGLSQHECKRIGFLLGKARWLDQWCRSEYERKAPHNQRSRNLKHKHFRQMTHFDLAIIASICDTNPLPYRSLNSCQNSLKPGWRSIQCARSSASSNCCWYDWSNASRYSDIMASKCCLSSFSRSVRLSRPA